MYVLRLPWHWISVSCVAVESNSTMTSVRPEGFIGFMQGGFMMRFDLKNPGVMFWLPYCTKLAVVHENRGQEREMIRLPICRTSITGSTNECSMRRWRALRALYHR